MIDISNSSYIINKDLLKYVYKFEATWIPMLDKMEYDEIVELIAKEGRSEVGSSSFSWAFLMHSYLVYFRLNYDNLEKRIWEVFSDVSFKFDFKGVGAFNNYIENMEMYLEEGGSMWDFEHLKSFEGYPELDD